MEADLSAVRQNYLLEHPIPGRFAPNHLCATREFMRQLFLLNGYGVDWAAVSVEQFLHAMEESVYDTGELETVLRSCLHKRDAAT